MHEIDGLRALALVSVILFHAGFEAFSGGYVGVDIFFVISGFLMTKIIMGQISHNNFLFFDFYVRRARRIIPALYVVLFFCILIAPLILWPLDYYSFSKSLLATVFGVSNVLFWRESGFFDQSVEFKPLLHTWSLSVEEQLYLVYPLFLITVSKISCSSRVKVVFAIFVTSLTLSIVGAAYKPTAAFYLLPTRIWEFLLGYYVCINMQRIGSSINNIYRGLGHLIGLLLILYAIIFFNKSTPYPGHYALVPTIGTALIILTIGKKIPFVDTILTNRIIVGVGLVSYSAYLIHQPVFAFVRNIYYDPIPKYVYLLLIGITFVLAKVCHENIELFFRNALCVSNKKFLTMVGFCLVTNVGVAVLGLNSLTVMQSLFINQMPEINRKFYEIVLASNQADADTPVEKIIGSDDRRCRLNFDSLNSENEHIIIDCYNLHGKGVLVLGDSHAIDLFGEIVSRFNNKFLIGITASGCRPHAPRSQCQYDAVLKFLESHPTMFNHIIYEQAGFYLLVDRFGNEGSREIFTDVSHDGTVTDVGVNKKNIHLVIDYLNKLSKFAPVTWFLPRVEPHINKKYIVKHGCEYKYKIRGNSDKIFEMLDQEILYNVKINENPYLKAISQNEIFKFNFPDDLLNCNDMFWSDGDHYSSSGERRFGKRLPADFLTY